jgi:hypothetical protein
MRGINRFSALDDNRRVYVVVEWREVVPHRPINGPPVELLGDRHWQRR